MDADQQVNGWAISEDSAAAVMTWTSKIILSISRS
jgi:hypothetical protein